MRQVSRTDSLTCIHASERASAVGAAPVHGDMPFATELFDLRLDAEAQLVVQVVLDAGAAKQRAQAEHATRQATASGDLQPTRTWLSHTRQSTALTAAEGGSS